MNANASEELLKEFKLYMSDSNKRMVKEHSHSLFYIANRLELSTETKDKLIQFSGPKEMNRFLVNEIKFINKIKEQETLLNQNFHLN